MAVYRASKEELYDIDIKDYNGSYGHGEEVQRGGDSGTADSAPGRNQRRMWTVLADIAGGV